MSSIRCNYSMNNIGSVWDVIGIVFVGMFHVSTSDLWLRMVIYKLVNKVSCSERYA